MKVAVKILNPVRKKLKTIFISVTDLNACAISYSGSTQQMTANKQHFATFEKFPIPQPVEVANKKHIHAYSYGSVNVEVCEIFEVCDVRNGCLCKRTGWL